VDEGALNRVNLCVGGSTRFFLWESRVEPAQLDVCKRPKIPSKSPLRFFFQVWVEHSPAEK